MTETVTQAGRLFLTGLLLAWCWLAALPATAALQAGNAPRWADLAEPTFQHLEPQQGLPHPNITALAQDQQGFIWVGTQGGLARWDGYRFRVFQADSQQADSLPDSFIHVLHLDQQQRLWIGSGNGGLARYDPVHERFERINGVAQGSLLALADAAAEIDQERQLTSPGSSPGPSGGLWIGSRNGLAHLNIASGRLTKFAYPGADALGAPSNVIRALVRDARGRLWLGTDHGLFYRDAQQARFVAVALPIAAGTAFRVLSLTLSQDGKLWIGTDGHGLFNLQSTLPTGPDLPALKPQRVNAALDDDLIFCMRQVDANTLWLATLGHGIVVLDQTSGRTRRLRHDPTLPHSLLDDSVWAILRDRSGLIWAGNNRGLSRHDLSQAPILSLWGGTGRPNSLPDTNVYSVLPLPDGRIWLGLANNGVAIVDSTARQLRWLAPDAKQGRNSLPPHPVNAMVGSWKEQIFLATQRGLYRSDLDGKRIELIDLAPRNAASEVRALALDVARQRLWLGGPGGLWQLALSGEGRVTRVAGAQALDQQMILSLELAPDGALWIGTRDAGLARLDHASGQLRQFQTVASQSDGMPSGAVASLLFDQSGSLWLGTLGGGIARLKNPATARSFERIGAAQGLQNQLVDKLLQDASGAIWASTDGGLARIDPASLQVRTLDRADGVLLHTFWNNAGAATAQGELLFGGGGGLVVVHPEQVMPWRYRPELVLTAVQNGGKNLPAGRFVALAGHAPEVLTVQPQANSIALEFASLDFSSPERNRYGWRLEGYDSNWRESDASQRQVSYTNLAPGDYRLHLRVSNRTGEWNPAQQVVQIQVLAAWHQTIWFRLLLLALLGLAVWGVVQVRTRFLRLRQLALVTQVRQRTRELRQKKRELKAANAGLAKTVERLHLAQTQLVEQEKLAALGGLVSGVAHEINTPLGTALVAMSGVQGVWQRLRQALSQGSLSKSLLEAGIEEGSDYTELALSTGSRAAGLITSFKEIAVCFDNEQSIELDLTQYLHEMATLVRASLEPAGRTLECQVPDGLHLRVVPEALTEALTSIFANVLDHAFVAGEGGVVCLRAECQPDAVLISITDNGQGIHPHHLPKVFDPFFTTQRGPEGHTGLGLHVAYNQVVQRLQGSISVKSELGQGTTVTLRLPLA